MTKRSTDQRGAALGDWVRGHREMVAWSQEEVASAMRRLGVPWRQSTVGKVERGARPLLAIELINLVRVLTAAQAKHCPWPELLIAPPIETFSEAERRAARRLGIDPSRLAALALVRWGRSWTDERDRRAGESGDRRSRQAMAGHATREMLGELRRARDQAIHTQCPQPCHDSSGSRAD